MPQDFVRSMISVKELGRLLAQMQIEDPKLCAAAVANLQHEWMGIMNLIMLALHRMGKDHAWEVLEGVHICFREQVENL